ncbi:MAG: hypothetical protein ACJ74O_13480 [Frankiaceae bacterium]|jgi:hypothetical protein
MASPTNVNGGILDGASNDGASLRAILTALVARLASGQRAGVVWGKDSPLQVFVDGADLGMWVKVRPGAAILPASYIVAATATAKVLLDAANGSFPRTDLIVAEPNDTGNATGSMRLRAVTGSPAASPTPPATPAGALALGTVTVPAAAPSISSAGSDLRVYTTAVGGLLVVTSNDLPAAADGPLLVFEPDTGALLFSDGTAWKYLLNAPETAIAAVASGFQITRTLRVSKQAGMVRLRGAVGPTSGNFATGVTIELGPGGGALVPSGFRPIATIEKPVAMQFGGGPPLGRLTINGDGTVELRVAAGTTSNAAYLDIEWPAL